MNDKTKKLTLSATIMALCSILVMIQIPLPGGFGLELDFSLAALLVGRRFIGIINSIIIASFYPFFSLVSSGTLIGIMFLILQTWFLLFIDYILNKDNMKILPVLLTIILVTIWSIILNVFIVGPLWSLSPDYSYLDDSMVWFLIALVFNPFKLSIVYLISWPLLFAIKKSINEKNDL